MVTYLCMIQVWQTPHPPLYTLPWVKKKYFGLFFWESLLLNQRNWIGYNQIDNQLLLRLTYQIPLSEYSGVGCPIASEKQPRNLRCDYYYSSNVIDLTHASKGMQNVSIILIGVSHFPGGFLLRVCSDHFNKVRGWDFGDCWEDRLVRGWKFMAYVQPVTWPVPVPQRKIISMGYGEKLVILIVVDAKIPTGGVQCYQQSLEVISGITQLSLRWWSWLMGFCKA